jgi:lysophospholipase L1-like esterase
MSAKRPEYDISVEVNSFGLRDDERSLDRPEIVVLGDSHAMGSGVSDEDAFSSLVERALDRKTLNAGISSFGTAREMMLLQSLDVRLDLSDLGVVILQYCDNDFRENAAYAEGKGDLAILTQEQYQQWVRLVQQQSESFLTAGLYVFRRAMEKTWERLIGPSRGELAANEADAFYYAVNANKELLRGKRLIVLEINGYNKNDADFIERVRERFKGSELDPHFIRTSEFLTDEDYYKLDNHMTPSGHRKVANAILSVIQNREARDATARAKPLAHSGATESSWALQMN